jgi:methylase of polypeptide subunit release factors
MKHSLFPRPTEMAHEWLRRVIVPGDCVVDATLGNGHDAVFLAQCVGTEGKVFGVDVQEQALQSATENMRRHGIADGVYEWHLASHARMGELVKVPVKAVMFNLGYLPGADHRLITTAEETLAALSAAAGLIVAGGMLTVVCYPGHEGGERETTLVTEWAEQQGAEWHVVHYQKRATRLAAPELIAMQRKEKVG